MAAPQELGETPQGRRRIIGITGGRFSGERLSGRAAVDLEVYEIK